MLRLRATIFRVMLPISRPPETTSPRKDRPRLRARQARRPIAMTSLSAVAAGILLLCAPTLRAQDLGGQWYVGAGAGGVLLRPDTEASGFDTDQRPTTSGTVYLGRDLDTRSSVQLQLHALGETTLESDDTATGEDDTVTYTGVDASVLYRFFDSRDRAPRGTVFGASLYGRFGLGYLRRDTDVALENDADINLGAGAGVEVYLSPSIALRAEGIFHDRDAGSASLSLVARFGGPDERTQRPPAPPARPPAVDPTAPIAPDVSAAPTTPTAPAVSAAPTAPTAPAAPTTPAAADAATAPTVPMVAAPTLPVPTTPGQRPAAGTAPPSGDRSVPLPNTSLEGPAPDPDSLPETLDLRTVDPARLQERPNATDGTGQSDVPGVPDAPDAPATPDAPALPDVPATPDAPDVPAIPDVPDVPAIPDVPAPPDEAGVPVVPVVPVVPTVPGDSGVPVDFGPSAVGGGGGDIDGDGVADADDTCPGSARGYPVRDNGCALLDGVLSSLSFTPGTAELAPGAKDQLDYLAELLNEYPDARVELIAHTDDTGDERGQAILGRARLRTLGTYLVQQGGVRANRLLLRSFGGTRPLYDNGTAEGRAANNRIEILERTASGQ